MLLPTIRPAGGQTAGLYVSRLDVAVQHYFKQGVAQSTLKTYSAAWKKFNQFCTVHNVTISFPISQSVLCYFAAYLGEQGLSYQTIQTYLSGVRFLQIGKGLLEPDPMPKLKVVKNGVRKA